MVFWKRNEDKTKYMLLVEPGGLGDYIIVRPYLKFIKQSPKYKDYKIIYLAKDIYTDFTATFDGEYFDKIISYNVKALETNKHYKKYLYGELNKYKFDTIVNLRCITVDWYIDATQRRRLIRDINAKNKIVDIVICNDKSKYKSKLKIYNKPILYSGEKLFEFERRRKFFEDLLEIKLPEIKIDENNENLLFNYSGKNYIVMSIFANHEKRLYPTENWIKITKHLLEKYPNTYLYFIGSMGDKQFIDKVVTKFKDERCINLAGKTPTCILPMLIKNCRIMIGVDTGTIHIANLVNCKTICLSCGQSYGRFLPYDNIEYILPDDPDKYKDDYNIWAGGIIGPISDIPVEKVIEKIDEKLMEINL